MIQESCGKSHHDRQTHRGLCKEAGIRREGAGSCGQLHTRYWALYSFVLHSESSQANSRDIHLDYKFTQVWALKSWAFTDAFLQSLFVFLGPVHSEEVSGAINLLRHPDPQKDFTYSLELDSLE